MDLRLKEDKTTEGNIKFMRCGSPIELEQLSKHIGMNMFIFNGPITAVG